MVNYSDISLLAKPKGKAVDNEDGFEYAAIVKDSYYVEGDERSRTNPCHGYPGHNVEYTKLEKFKDKDSMVEWVKRQETSFMSAPYTIIKYKPMKVTINIDVE